MHMAIFVFGFPEHEDISNGYLKHATITLDEDIHVHEYRFDCPSVVKNTVHDITIPNT